MKYISVDIETTGLDPEKNKVISVAAIIEDTETKLPFNECPKFNVAILQNELIGSARALTINKELISEIADYQDANDETRKLIDSRSDYKFIMEDDVAKEFYWWLDENGFGYGLHNNSGGYGDFKQTLEKAHVIVSFGSVADVEALIRGVPVIGSPYSPANPVSNNIKDIENLTYFDRTAWLSSLAASEWHKDEMDKCWDRLKGQLNGVN